MFNVDLLKRFVCYIMIFLLGFFCSYIFYPRSRVITKYSDKIISGNVQTHTSTELSYIPKATIKGTFDKEKTDLEVSVPKQELNIKINGREAAMSKADDEQYLFEKNKVQLTQQSKAEINIEVPTIDGTKYWELGIGYGTNGVAGQVGFPINKKRDLGGWIYGDKKPWLAALVLGFNICDS